MLNLSALDNKIEIVSYDTYLVTHLILPEFQRKLVETYLSHGFKEFTLQKGNENIEKNFGYQFEFLSLEDTSKEYLIEKGFEALWVEFIQQITSSVYIAKLSEATNIKLQDKNYKLEFTRYRPGDWSDPHYDKQHKKVLTQLFYFNAFWDIDWGGYLNVLNPSDLNQIVLAVPPLVHSSLLIKATPNAWHGVSKVNMNAEMPRLNAVLQFYEK